MFNFQNLLYLRILINSIIHYSFLWHKNYFNIKMLMIYDSPFERKFGNIIFTKKHNNKNNK